MWTYLANADNPPTPDGGIQVTETTPVEFVKIGIGQLFVFITIYAFRENPPVIVLGTEYRPSEGSGVRVARIVYAIPGFFGSALILWAFVGLLG